MVKLHGPAILVLLEIEMDDHKCLTNVMEYDAQVQSLTVGLTGGIVFIWKEDLLQRDYFNVTPQGIHAIVKVISNPYPWLFSSIYASLDLNNRRLLWDELSSIS